MDPGVPVFGRKGCSIHVQEVTRSLIHQGAEIDLFACRLGGPSPKDLEGVSLHELPIPKCKPVERERLSIASNRDLLYTLESKGPFDLIYERYSLWSHAAMEYALKNRIPGILEVNAPLIEEQVKHRFLLDRSTAQNIASRVFDAATTLVAVSQGVAEYLNNYPGANGKVHVIPNGVNPDSFPKNIKPSLPAPDGTFTVGFVGTLKPWHDITTLIEAFIQMHQKHSNTRLLIVGDGPEKERLEEYVASSNAVSSVEFTGSVDPTEIPGLLASMDVAAAPYKNLKNFYFSPLKVLEYMAAGLPVVASNIGQLTELIQDSKNGILITPDDPVAMAEAIDRLRLNPDLRKLMGQEARNCVLSNYTWGMQVERILDLSKHSGNLYHNN
jgi:glycosyltransferase involved in cell wall biosynthesis